MKFILMQHMRTTNIPTSIIGLTFNQDGKTVTPSQGASPTNPQYNFYYLFEDRVIDLSSRALFLNSGGQFYYDELGLCVFGGNVSWPVGTSYFYTDQYGYVVNGNNYTLGGMFIFDSGQGIVNANNEFFTYQSYTELRKCLWGDYVNYFKAQGLPDANLVPYTVLALDFNGYNDYGFGFYYGVGMADQSFSFYGFNPSQFSGITEGIAPICSIFSGMAGAQSTVLIDAIGQSAMYNYQSTNLGIDNKGQLYINYPSTPVTITHYNGTSDNVFGVMFADSSLFNQVSNPMWHVFPAFGKLYALLNLGGPFYELYENGPSHINWEYSLTYQPLILQNYKLGVK